MFLADLPIDLVTLDSFNNTQQSPEDGTTFRENALTKAHFYMQKTGIPSLADDGGIEIDVFNGEPGVASHRWISQDKDDSDADLIAYTLSKMKDIPLSQRGAQMHLVLALVFPDGREFITEGIVRGIVAEKVSEHKMQGFPFRSLFYIPEIRKYYDHSEMTNEEIKKYDHRKAAVDKMRPILEQEFKI